MGFDAAFGVVYYAICGLRKGTVQVKAQCPFYVCGHVFDEVDGFTDFQDAAFGFVFVEQVLGVVHVGDGCGRVDGECGLR